MRDKKGNKISKRERQYQRKRKYQRVDICEFEKSLRDEKLKARMLRHSAWWKEQIAQGKCYYCGKSFKPQELTMDHKIPLSKGGTSEKSNIVPACKECNYKKKYLLPNEWKEYLSSKKFPNF